jgi:hypothetical protein
MYETESSVIKQHKEKVKFLINEFARIKNDILTLRQSLTKDQISAKTFRLTRAFKDLEKTVIKGRNRLYTSKNMLEVEEKLPRELNDFYACYTIMNNITEQEKLQEKQSGEMLYNLYHMCSLFDSVLTDIDNTIEVIEKDSICAIM